MSDMNQNSDAVIVDLFEYQLEFRLDYSNGAVFTDSGAALFKKDALEIKCSSGKKITVEFRDIQSFEGKNYRVFIRLQSGDNLELFYLGYHYENFLKTLTCVRNDVIKQDLLMHESLLFVAEEIEYVYLDSEKRTITNGPCNAQVSDTALIIASPDGSHIKLPLSYVASVREENYTLNILMETGESICLRMLGRQREPLLLNIEGAIKRLEDKALLLFENIFGKAKVPKIREAAVLFKDGRAVSKKTLDSFSDGLWIEMENRLSLCGLTNSYQFLKQYGMTDYSSIGFKRGLMGDLTGEYIWFLIPIGEKKMIAMESGSTSLSGGQATYFFKLPDDSDIETFISQINYCLFMINFRREPIYLTDLQLQKPAYKDYLFAIERIPALRILRKLFIGRIIHTSPDQWEKGVEELIKA